MPQLPRDFRGVGRYIVPDLNENVAFTWQGKDGNSQMTAGGPKDRIWFENLIYRGTLYTITYEWPGLKEEEKAKCVAFGGLDRDWLNGTLLKTSRYVGKEVLQGDAESACEPLEGRFGVPTGHPARSGPAFISPDPSNGG